MIKKTRKLVSLLLSGALVFGLLAGCGGGTTSTPAPAETGSAAPESTAPATTANEITVNIASEPQTIDPALNSAVDGAIMINHMFEGLMRWVDSGVETAGSDGTCTISTTSFEFDGYYEVDSNGNLYIDTGDELLGGYYDSSDDTFALEDMSGWFYYTGSAGYAP